ncbi:MAG: hypothetical protein LWX83_00130 [Anaerolineae bacterium]|nr:hypothetical protein [Anaerolineae bacterium]
MPVKLLMSWDIAPEHEEEYFEFVVREFLPGVQGLGFELSDAWATVYGPKPQMLVGAMLPSINQAHKVLNSSEWISLNNRLQDYVRNYNYKLVSAKGGFQF